MFCSPTFIDIMELYTTVIQEKEKGVTDLQHTKQYLFQQSIRDKKKKGVNIHKKSGESYQRDVLIV